MEEIVRQQIETLNEEYKKGNLTDDQYNSQFDLIMSQLAS